MTHRSVLVYGVAVNAYKVDVVIMQLLGDAVHHDVMVREYQEL